MSEQQRRAPASYPSNVSEEQKAIDERLTNLVEQIANLRGMQVGKEDSSRTKLKKLHDALIAEYGVNPKLTEVRVMPDLLWRQRGASGLADYSGKQLGPLTRSSVKLRDYTELGNKGVDKEAYNALASTLAHELMHSLELSSNAPSVMGEKIRSNPKHFLQQPSLPSLPEGFQKQQETYEDASDYWLQKFLEDRIEKLKRSPEEQDIVDLMGDVVK